jgi:hypothetical protein
LDGTDIHLVNRDTDEYILLPDLVVVVIGHRAFVSKEMIWMAIQVDELFRRLKNLRPGLCK